MRFYGAKIEIHVSKKPLVVFFWFFAYSLMLMNTQKWQAYSFEKKKKNRLLSRGIEMAHLGLKKHF